VIAGGHAAFNPEPIADFIDAAVLGDGEQAVLAITDVVRDWKARGGPAAATELLLRLARTGGVYVPRVLRRRLPARRPHPARRAQPARRAVAGLEAHRDGPRRVALPEDAAGAARRDRARADERRDLPRLHARLPLLPGRHDHPAGARAQRSTGIGEMVEQRAGRDRLRGGRPAQPVQRRPLRDRRDRQGLADRYEGTETGLSLPSTRVDAFNIDLANELTRNGRRSGLTFAPEGGSERMRKVINKMVTEDDLIRTVTTAYGNGWRQVKLYFMCGLPTETDEDVLQIARARQAGDPRPAARPPARRDIRCTVSIGGFVPKPHTPFQWAAQLDHETTDAGCAAARRDPRRPPVRTRRSASATTTASPASSRACSRAATAGSAVIEQAWRRRRPLRRLERALLLRPLDGGRRAALEAYGVDVDWYTTRERDATPRCCPGTTSTPASTSDWLWEDWQDALGTSRGRGLPLDAVLRLRRLPADGHRHPGRPHRDPAGTGAAGRRRERRRSAPRGLRPARG
jgi:radical SAM superfamily enzyme YgiQ (UPF0313 family)